MHLKIISFLLLVSLLSECGNESSPPSAYLLFIAYNEV